jgi:hypothetical protein
MPKPSSPTNAPDIVKVDSSLNIRHFNLVIYWMDKSFDKGECKNAVS